MDRGSLTWTFADGRVFVCMCVLQRNARKSVSSALCACWSMEARTAPASRSAVTEPTLLCVGPTAKPTITTAREGVPSATAKPPSMSNSKGPVVS